MTSTTQTRPAAETTKRIATFGHGRTLHAIVGANWWAECNRGANQSGARIVATVENWDRVTCKGCANRVRPVAPVVEEPAAAPAPAAVASSCICEVGVVDAIACDEALQRRIADKSIVVREIAKAAGVEVSDVEVDSKRVEVRFGGRKFVAVSENVADASEVVLRMIAQYKAEIARVDALQAPQALAPLDRRPRRRLEGRRVVSARDLISHRAMVVATLNDGTPGVIYPRAFEYLDADSFVKDRVLDGEAFPDERVVRIPRRIARALDSVYPTWTGVDLVLRRIPPAEVFGWTRSRP